MARAMPRSFLDFGHYVFRLGRLHLKAVSTLDMIQLHFSTFIWKQIVDVDRAHNQTACVLAGPQPPKRTPTYLIDKMSDKMVEHMSGYMPSKCQHICQKVCQNSCQIECQNICQIRCHTEGQIECQMECQNTCQIICQLVGATRRK